MVAPGDHVVTLFSPQCGECVHCKSPRTNLCLAIRDMQGKGFLPDGTTRLSRDGESIRHFMGTSTFAEYTVMPQIALAKINPEAPLDRACLFACGLSTGLGAAMNTAAVEAGSTCVVFGAGMVGLGAVAGCRLQGAERIACVDMSPDRLELARGQGATDVLMGGPDVVAQILEMTDGFGADYTFEATGNVAVMRQAVEAARMGWGLATVAGVAGKGETLDVVPRFLITGRRIAGSSFGGVKGRDRRPGADRALARGRNRRRPVRLPPPHAGRREPRLRADGGPGRHPQRDPLLLASAWTRTCAPPAAPSSRRPGSLRPGARSASTSASTSATAASAGRPWPSSRAATATGSRRSSRACSASAPSPLSGSASGRCTSAASCGTASR